MTVLSQRRVAPEPVGALLIRVRQTRGWSQLRLADSLCAAAGHPTVSRHEVSRWERGERLPGPYWLGWLAQVLAVPFEQLEAAVAAARAGHRPDRTRTLGDRPGQSLASADLLTALDQADLRGVPQLAYAWLAAPSAPPPAAPPGPAWLDGGTARDTLAALDGRLRQLRRLDDLFGGRYLAARVDRELRALLALLPRLGTGHPYRRGLRVVADYAQLAGWVQADAGHPTTARRAYRVALHAATAAADRRRGAYVLAALSHQCLATDSSEALRLAQIGRAGARTAGSALTEALLLQRIALAHAQRGEPRPAYAALREAERAADRSRPGDEPAWLYWLDARERSAMTGRCLAVLGRPLRAVRLLAGHPHTGPRTAAIYAAWLARSHLALGEVEQACRIAIPAHARAAAAGSVRATTALKHLRPMLRPYRDLPAVQRYERILAG